MNKNEFLASVCERDIDLLLLEEASINAEFQSWLIMRLYGEPIEFSNFEAYHSYVSEGRESDLIFRFSGTEGTGQQVALLVENKIDAVHQPDQGLGYNQRGIAGKERGDWTAFKTCIMAPFEYLNRPDTLDHKYDSGLSYEEILAFFWSRRLREPRYKYRFDVLMKAIDKSRRTYGAKISPEMTAFVQAYFAYASQHAHGLGMYAPKPRPASSTWIEFRPVGYPQHINLCHQLSGAVKAFWQGSADRFDEITQSATGQLASDMELAVSGKSVSLSIKMQKVDAIGNSFEVEKSKVALALDALKRLDAVVRKMEGIGDAPLDAVHTVQG